MIAHGTDEEPAVSAVVGPVVSELDELRGAVLVGPQLIVIWVYGEI